MPHIMLDIETLGTKPGSVILSIGAVEFDPKSDIIKIDSGFHQAIDPQSSVEAGLKLDVSTVMWWMQQSDEARAEFNRPSAPLKVALRDLSSWAIFSTRVGDQFLWCHGPAFDAVLLEAAYRAVGLRFPFSYRGVRCTRTIYDLARVSLQDFPQTGTYHNALDDAITQAKAVQAAYRKLGLAAESVPC